MLKAFQEDTDVGHISIPLSQPETEGMLLWSMCDVRCAILKREKEIESEDDSLDDEVDAAAEEEYEAADDVPSAQAAKKAVAPIAPAKDTERQLSKKELKKKELEELDAVLAELGISDKATQHEANDKKGACEAADGEEKEDATVPSESKTSKKKKAKKDRSSKEAKETHDQNDMADDAAGAEPDEDAASVDVKERIKKVASMKKKKSSKEMDAAAKIAASEAAARRAKLAAAKKKDKNHYNQQPLRWTAA